MMNKVLVISGSFLLLILSAIQFIPFNTIKNQTNIEADMLTLATPSAEVAGLIKNACYDCHSNNTIFPWYYKIAPLSWMINSHISEAREYMNFSDWSTYSSGDQIGILESCAEEIEKNEMPLFSYTVMHPLARLDDKEKTLIINWMKSFISYNENLSENTDEN